MSEKNTTDLTEFIRDVKKQITDSEDPRPEKGFWMGVQIVELEVDAITESKKGGGITVYVLHGEVEKTTKSTQRIKISMATQYYEPKKEMTVSRGRGLYADR